MKIKYQKIYQQFLEDKWQRLGEYYYSMPTKDFEKIKENDINEKMEEMDRLFHFIRGSYFFGTNLQSNISWNFSSTANYGEVTIFAGDFAKRIGLDKSRTSRKPFKGSEVTTPNSVMNNGDFAEISLHDPDILIIGPKNILEKYQDVYSNLIFKEDLLPEMSLKLELELPIQLP